MYHCAHLFGTEGKIQDFIRARKAVCCLSYTPSPMTIALWALFSTVSVTEKWTPAHLTTELRKGD